MDAYGAAAPVKEPPKEIPEKYWYTGYGGNKPAGYQPNSGGNTGGVYFGQAPGTPGYNATSDAFWKKQGDFDQALGALRAGQFMPAGLPNAAMQGFTNPQGFDPRALQARMAALADTEGGSRMNALDALEKSAAARGFRNSIGVMDAAARLRANSAANLMRQQNEVFYEGEKAKLQEKGIAAGLLGGMTAAEAAMLRALASMHANRPRDVIPGISDGTPGGGGTWKFLDPKTGQVIYNPPGGWSPDEFAAMQRERVLWELSNGGKVNV